MTRYALRRLVGILPTLLAIVTAAFFLMRLAPGGPFDEEQTVPPEILANLQAAYGLDQPVLVQYRNYLVGLLHGDLGPSFRMKDFSVAELIARGLPVTLTIGSAALLLALLLGVPLGLLAARRHNGWVDHAVMGIALAGIAVPNFVVAPVLALVFGVRLGWLPVAGWEPGSLRHVLLPAVTLALPFVAYIARLTRGSLLEVLQSPYIRTARAKGLSGGAILRRHALRPTLLPVVSFLGPATAALLTGSLVVEQVFGLPGIGRYFVQGAINRDYTLVMGMVVFYAVLILLLNLVVDLLYGWLDPRIRHDSASRGLLADAWRRLRRNRAAIAALAMLGALVVASLVGPALSQYSIDQVDWTLASLASPPSLGNGHWFGTDSNGRDLFVRVWAGTQVSLLVALLATAVSLVIGVAWGATAGYLGGRVDDWMMRFVDVLYALPYMFFVIILTVVFGRSLFLIFLAIGAVGWLTMARIVRGQALSLRNQPFVDAAITLGLPARSIIARHIVPNVVGTVIVYATLTVPQVILFESFLSFLGLGVQEPLTSLGRLVAEGAVEMESAPWQLLVPSAVLATILLCLNFLGDGLRDALDPRQR